MDNAIALQVQTPNSMNTIGSMLDVARGAQALKGQRQQIESQGLELQKQRQANDERLRLQDFMSQPDNFQTNGRIDLDKVNKAIPAIAPLTGAKVIEHLTTLGNAQTGAEQAQLGFTGQERSIVSGLFGILGRAGVKDPKQVSAELDNLKAQYKDSPAMVKYIDNAKVGLQNAPPGDHLTKTLITQSQALLSPESQQSLNPTATLQNTGSQLTPIVTQPAVGGNAPNISASSTGLPLTVSPENRETLATDSSQNTNVVTKDAQGRIIAARPAPGGGGTGGTGGTSPFQRFAPGQKDDIAHAQQEVSGIRQQGDQVPIARNINSKILELSRSATTGPGTPRWQQVLAGASLGQFGDNYQELGKFLEKNALQQLQAMGGPPSDARLSAATAANGSTQFNPGALQAVTKFNDATTSALDKYRQGVDKAVGLANSDYTKLPAFKAAWAKNMDVDIFRVENAVRDGDKEELGKISKELGPARMKALAQKRQNLETLSTNGKL